MAGIIDAVKPLGDLNGVLGSIEKLSYVRTIREEEAGDHW